MSFHQLLENKIVQTSANHWFNNKGLNFADLYDVTQKLTHIYGVSHQWEVMPFIKLRFFPTVFKRYFEKWLQTSKRYLAIPAGTNRHWTYILVDRKSKVIEHWDGIGNKKALHHPQTQFIIKLALVYLKKYLGKSFRVINQVNICHQYRDKNCGLYAIRFMEEKMKGLRSESISLNLNYDIESYKSRFHWIRCSSFKVVKTNRKSFMRQHFCFRPQYEKLPRFSYSRIKFYLFSLHHNF
ncbi:MAG: Ulp1 family isopeptidase [Oligoflexales bacterium]